VRALVGHTGFVGTTLKSQTRFDLLVHRPDVGLLHGTKPDLMLVAAAPAAKWIANREAEVDRLNVEALFEDLRKADATRVLLISTVDVYSDPVAVDEDDEPTQPAKEPYGRHRLWLENAVRSLDAQVTIVRLPGLYGEGLRKNFLYDLVRGEGLEFTDSRSRFQFYDMSRLWADLERVLETELPTVHLVTEPTVASKVAKECFGVEFHHHHHDRPPARYDARTVFAAMFGGSRGYIQPEEDVLEGIRRWAGAVDR